MLRLTLDICTAKCEWSLSLKQVTPWEHGMEWSLQDQQTPPRQVEWSGELTQRYRGLRVALPDLLAKMTLCFTLDWPPPFDLHHHKAFQQASHSGPPSPDASQEVHQPHPRRPDKQVNVFNGPRLPPIKPQGDPNHQFLSDWPRLQPTEPPIGDPNHQSLLNMFH